MTGQQNAAAAQRPPLQLRIARVLAHTCGCTWFARPRQQASAAPPATVPGMLVPACKPQPSHREGARGWRAQGELRGRSRDVPYSTRAAKPPS
eukprot:366117-Chlamydomonas_euryale.AAC.10